MKKFLLGIFLLSISIFSTAQEIDKSKAYQLLLNNNDAMGLTPQEIQASIITNAYHDNYSDLTRVYAQQSYKGLPVFNQLKSLAFRNGKVCADFGTYINDIEKRVNNWSILPSLTPAQALKVVLDNKKIFHYGHPEATAIIPGKKYEFGQLGVAQQNISAELMWVPVQDGQSVILAWQIDLMPSFNADHWLTRVDAQSGALISETNLTVYCNWGHELNSHTHHADLVMSARKNKANSNTSSGLFTGFLQQQKNNTISPMMVNSATYRVVPFPYESPRHYSSQTGLVTDPWTAAPGNATSLKWHSTGTNDYNYTRGNNVWAQEDANGNNGTGTPATSTTPDPLSFNFSPNFSLAPTQAAIAPNQQFNITNLFYWNNIIHDVTYRYGFDEVAGNFQSNNQSRGGAGNDYVLADAQDGSGTNNANFSTPADGGSGRMQMYLWNPTTNFNVNTPSSIAGPYQAVESNFSTGNKLINMGAVTGQVIIFNDDATGLLHEACGGAPVNTITGKIALIDRGTCNFTVKVKNAQNAGAIAAIVVNNDATAPIIMGGTDNTITIPAIMISQADGVILRNQLANNLNVTMSSGAYLDGDVDNGVIVHEYSHGISNRLTGGPAQASCLSNAEQMGEGWSDYVSLMLTQDWANSNVNTGFSSPRSMGTYVFGQTPSQSGIRSQKYCTDFTVNNKVYDITIPSEIHDLGEIWCATLWDMTWNIIQQTNAINADIYDSTTDAGNSIALRLVLEGMKLQPCSPGFIDGRNAILKADSLLFGGAYSCSIREAFRRRGMGLYASQGSSSSISDQTPDFTPLINMVKSENIRQASEGQQIVYTTTISSCSPLTNYTLRDTLPTNITYVSGGTYDVANRVVSFPVNMTSAGTQTYSFTVSVNTGSYFTPQTYIDEQVNGTAIPSSFTATSTTANTWSVSNVLSQSSPNALFTPNAAVASDQKLETTSAITLGTGTSSFSFASRYITQSGVDGAVVEVSTNNGTSWTDLNSKITSGYYNATLSTGSGNPLVGRKAWSGNNGSFVKTSVNLSSYAGQSVKLRFRLGSSSTVAGTGWYVDDIVVKNEAVVNIRANLFNSSNTRVNYSDTVTQIIETVVCNPVAVSAQPGNIIACEGGNTSFTITTTGTNPAYHWQVSTDGGNTYSDITGATTSTLTLNAVSAAMNNNRYRVLVSNNCPSNATSGYAILTVNAPASITAQPAATTVCEGAAASFSITASGTNNAYQWQSSTDNGNTWNNISGATGTSYSIAAASASQNGTQYRVMISSCSPSAIYSNPATLTVSNLASITTQPANTPACTGSTANFSVSASGSSLTYQWQVSTDNGITWNNISGATSGTLNISNVSSSMNNYKYRVLISNSCSSSITSTAGMLIVSDPASIVAQPLSNTVCEGQHVNFLVSASGTNITYQWQVSSDGGISWTNLSGATTASLNLNNVSASLNNNQYRAVLYSCSATGLNSSAAILTVNALATISSMPNNTSACTGSSASFSVTTSGNAVNYQWQVSTDGGITYNDISGATAATLTLSNLTASMNSNLYHVLVSNSCTSAFASASATLSVLAQPVVNSQPAAVSVCPGGTATFNVSASGPSLTYQWQVSTDGGLNYNNLSGATGATLTISPVTPSLNNNQYRAQILSSCGSSATSSSSAALQVLNEISLDAQPSDYSGCAGSNATFTANAVGTGITYQWQVSTDGGATYTNISGATNSSLTVASITTAMNNNRYRVLVGASPCGAISNSALLNVSPSPVVHVTASPYQSLYPGLTTVLTATAIPATNSFNWYKNGNLVAGITGNTITVNYDERGAYTAKSLNGCDNISNTINIGDSATTNIYIYPNPNQGEFHVQFYSGQTGKKYTVSLFDAKGARVYQKEVTTNGTGYESIDVSAKKLSSGTYMLRLSDETGKTIKSAKVLKI